jgi:hypothetical protein
MNLGSTHRNKGNIGKVKSTRVLDCFDVVNDRKEESRKT